MVKYQVFISSTYEDLKDERAQVIKSVLEMGHIPVGMEMFSAADEEQWKIIARQIDETDYYVLIVGNRYGSVTGGVSFTEKEFDYATSKGVPVLGFIVDPSVEPLAKHVDKEEEKAAALAKFKLKVKQRPIGFWKTPDDLHGKVSIALMKAFNTNPRPGWSRTTSSAGPEVIQELSRLSRENSDLREQLALTQNQEAIDKRAELQSVIDTLKANPINLQIKEKGKTTWDIRVSTNLFDIFTQISTELMTEATTTYLGTYLAILNKPDGTEIAAKGAIPTNHVTALIADFSSLNLIEPSKKKHAVSDTESYWTLTQTGIDVLKLDRAYKLEKQAAKAAAVGQAESHSPKPKRAVKKAKSD